MTDRGAVRRTQAAARVAYWRAAGVLRFVPDGAHPWVQHWRTLGVALGRATRGRPLPGGVRVSAGRGGWWPVCEGCAPAGWQRRPLARLARCRKCGAWVRGGDGA